MPATTQTDQAPQPISTPTNPSRPPRKMSTSGSGLRFPSTSRTGTLGASPMSFGAAMSGISFGNGGGGYSYNRNGSYGARFYGDTMDSPQIPFSSSINMDVGSFAASSTAFALPIGGSSYGRRSYAMAVSLGKDYGAHMLSASLASLTTGNHMGSLSHSYSKGQLESLMTLRNEAEHMKEYECCGIKHNGLHALLEHVEDQHPYPEGNMGVMPDAGFSPVTLAMDLDLGEGDEVPSATHSNRSSTSPRPVPNYPLTPTSTIGPKPSPPTSSAVTSLQLSDVLKSPPVDETNRGLPIIGTSPSEQVTPTATARNSPTSPFTGPAPKITPASRGAFLGGPSNAGSSRFDRAFNEVVAGNKTGAEDASTAKPPGPVAVAPGVLFSAAAALGMPSAPAVVGRQNGAPSTATPAAVEEKPEEKDDKAANGDRSRVPEPHLPQPSLFTTHKAWRCPNPGCNKAYKQSNGLKYHLQKGQCDFAIHDAIDHGLTLEEAEERSRPYVCAVGAGCTKRYRQMNGLKYHYLNSGEHGQYGLRMLQNGTHPHPPSHPPVPKRDRASQAAANASVRANAAPYTVPSQMNRPAPAATGGHPAPRMGTWPTPQRTNGTTATTTATATAQPRPPAVPSQPSGVSVARAAPAASAVTPKPAPAPSATPAPKMAPVQRGRDAVLFANVDPLDV